jgi:transcriptional regulator with XRE-family HTH domain
MSYQDFYERVKSQVKARKMTIKYVVGKAGLTLASYNAYRRHENLPRANEAAIMARTLGTTVEYLVFGKEPRPSAADEAFGKIEAAIGQYRKITHQG